MPDRRAAEPLWELLADDKVSKEQANPLMMGLMTAYLGQQYYNPSGAPAAARHDLADDAKRRVRSGGDWQRAIALLLLASADRDEAAAAAAEIADDAKRAAWLRNDAFQYSCPRCRSRNRAWPRCAA